MLARNGSIPKPNVYSSTLLFEQADDRNKKRMAQMLKRKTALSAMKNKSQENDKCSSSLIKSPISQHSNNNNDLLNNQKKDKNNNNINNLECEKDINNKEKNEIDIIGEIKKNFNYDRNMLNLDCSPILSNTMFNENNNYYNNSSTNNSNNNSIINRDSQEKEINISNLENDSIDDIIINKEDNIPEEESLINQEKIFSKSLYNYDHDDDNIKSKEERKIKEENEFALKYLTSSSDSFVQLDNHLVARAKAQGNEMTDSYLQALFPDLVLDPNKPLKTKNYEVSEIIKEEKEIEFDSPFGNNLYISKINRKINRESLNLNLILKNNNSLKRINKDKKTLIKTKSNAQLLNKRNNINKIEYNNKNITKYKTFANKKFKSSSNFQNNKKIIKNNSIFLEKPRKEIQLEKKTNEKDKLNMSLSLSNINTNKNKKNNLYLKNKNHSELYSTFSSNFYNRAKTEFKINKNIKNKNSSTNLLEDKNELNDASLICNCIKNIHKPNNSKISNHYLKNINYYNKCNETTNKNKNIKRRNQTENYINELHSTILTNTSNTNYLKSSYITKKPKYTLINNNSKKNLILKSNNINTINKLNTYNTHTHKQIIHKNCISSFSLNESKKPKKCLTKNSRVKSFSKLIIQKNEDINNYIKTETNLRKTKSNHKKLNTISITEFNIIESSFTITKNKTNINYSNNVLQNEKPKLIHFHKKIDYSYVKAKVETGLREDVLKKLINNNKKLLRKENAKKTEQEKKQSLFKKCKTNMNKTIESLKTMASNIKNKFFKKDRVDKNNVK